MKMYDEIADFKNKFGHTRVPYRWSKNPKLSDWVYRTKLGKGKLNVQKIELLKEINFDWTLRRRTVILWEDMYTRLLSFKQKYGHTGVPAKWEEDKKLGKWVSRMRHERKKLTPERSALLEALSFAWVHVPKAVLSNGVQ